MHVLRGTLDPGTLWEILSLILSALVVGVWSFTTIRRSADEVVFTVTATADGNQFSPSFEHNMGVIPEITLTPILQAPAAVSRMSLDVVDTATVSFEKSTGVGSGNAAPQLRVTVRRPR